MLEVYIRNEKGRHRINRLKFMLEVYIRKKGRHRINRLKFILEVCIRN